MIFLTKREHTSIKGKFINDLAQIRRFAVSLGDQIESEPLIKIIRNCNQFCHPNTGIGFVLYSEGPKSERIWILGQTPLVREQLVRTSEIRSNCPKSERIVQNPNAFFASLDRFILKIVLSKTTQAIIRTARNPNV